MSHPLIDVVEKPYLKSEVAEFRVGDSVDVLTRILEGDKERIQTFHGIVIAREGRGVNASFTVRRTIGDEGVERKFLLHSPNVTDIRVKRRGRVRRAKLYYLRSRIGKARKLREIRGAAKKTAEPELAAAPA